MKVLALGIAFVLLVTISGSAQQQGSNDPIHFVGNYIEVVGIGRPPDNEKGPGGYGPARRAAVLEAYQAIAETTRGVLLESATVADMGKLASDRIVAAVRANIKACTVVDNEEVLRANYNARGDVTLRCRADLTGSGGVLASVIDIVAPEISKKLEAEKLPVYTPPPSAPPADYDGLIVRVPARFKPSLYPKIRTDKGEVVYSMKDVSLTIQKNRGLATYTDDVGKAASSLRDLGAKSILTVDGFLFLDTEAGIKNDDAAKIAAANRKTAFLNSARVVFVISKPS